MGGQEAMKKTSPRRKSRKARELEPFSRTKVDFTKFKPDLSPRKLDALFTVPGRAELFPSFYFPVDTLSVTRTVGKGRTNLTFIRPTIVQADATTPYAGFDRRQSPSRKPSISMHFEPGAYGISTVSSYVMDFSIESVGSSTFNLDGLFGAIANAGSKVLNGPTTVSLVFQNVQPSQQIYGYVEQESGGEWNFYSVRVRFPSLLIGS
jgi:hypothetical protein